MKCYLLKATEGFHQIICHARPKSYCSKDSPEDPCSSSDRGGGESGARASRGNNSPDDANSCSSEVGRPFFACPLVLAASGAIADRRLVGAPLPAHVPDQVKLPPIAVGAFWVAEETLLNLVTSALQRFSYATTIRFLRPHFQLLVAGASVVGGP